MDLITSEAIGSLTGALAALLPPGATPALAPSLLVLPEQVRPTGLGGYAGLQAEPAGEVHGRRITARVNVTVAAQNAAGVDAAVTAVVNGLMNLGRDELASLGILRLGLGSVGPRPVPASGPPAPLLREVSFDVLYEYLKLPVAGGGVIQTIPLDIDGTLADRAPRVLARGPFGPAALTQFEAIDDPLATTGGPSAWSFAAAESSLVQTAAIRGGPNTSSAVKPGTYLTLRPTPLTPAVRDFSLAASVRSSSTGGLGFVFRFSDPDNFYYLLLDSTGFRRLGKKVAGAFAPLQAGGLDSTAGFTVGAQMRLRLVVVEDTFRLRLDGEEVLEGFDGELIDEGRVGFMTRNCTGAQFADLTLLRL